MIPLRSHFFSRTFLPALIACTGIATLLTACGEGARRTGGAGGYESDYDGPPVTGGQLTEIVSAEPANINPYLATGDAYSRYMGSYIFEAPMWLNLDTFELEPWLATSIERSEDALTYTLHLRDDIHFSDGKPLTAEDVKFSFDVVLQPENDTAPLRVYLKDIEAIEIIDDYTVRFKMAKTYYINDIIVGTQQIVPKHIYGQGDFNTADFNRAPVGSGPYKFERWDTGQQIVLTRDENYWGEGISPAQGYIDRRVFKIITDDEAAFQVLTRHEADMWNQIPPTTWLRRTNTPKFESEFHKLVPDSPIPGFTSRFNYIGWNMRKPQFEDIRVRQALVMLFDRQLIIDEVWGGLGTIITGPDYHKSPEYNKDIEPWPFDPERAQALLTEAGWVDRNSDGVREKDGVNLRFELSYASGVPEYDQLGTVYQEELKRAGIDMRLNPMEWATFQERVHKRTFDACMLAWLTTFADDPYQLWHSSQTETGSNYPGFKNAEVDKLIEQARVTFDEEERNALYHRFHAILHEEQPYIFLYARPGLVAVDKRFHGIKMYPGGLDPLEWFIPPDLQRN